MGLLRSALLAGSQSRWLRAQATRRRFVRRAVRRFMPGESLDEALQAAERLRGKGIAAVLTRLGEDVQDEGEADAVAAHYLDVLDRIAASGGEISVKLTQLGLGLDRARCLERLHALAGRAHERGSFVWIDMEQSRHTDATLALCQKVRADWAEVGVCLQAYLRRTPADAEAVWSWGAGLRLVKGAYHEPPARAYPRKSDVDASYLELAGRLLDRLAQGGGPRVVFGTHDMKLVERIRARAAGRGLPGSACEFHLLYGIHRAAQERLAREGATVRVLISYGTYWFPWYMRRLAERPANMLFLARSLFTR